MQQRVTLPLYQMSPRLLLFFHLSSSKSAAGSHVFHAGPYRAFGEQFIAVSERDLDGVATGFAAPIPARSVTAYKIVAASSFFRARLMIKWTKDFTARQVRSGRNVPMRFSPG